MTMDGNRPREAPATRIAPASSAQARDNSGEATEISADAHTPASLSSPTPAPRYSPPLSPRWLDLTESVLLADCHFETYRGPGPGGQKRNKTSNSIRLTHTPTGLHVIAGESRSQSENKMRAVRRLELKLATEIRHPIDALHFEPPAWFPQVVQLGRLAISHRNDHYARTAALVLDVLQAQNGNIAHVAQLLGVTTSSVVKFLEAEPHLWSAANAIRKLAGQKAMERRGHR